MNDFGWFWGAFWGPFWAKSESLGAPLGSFGPPWASLGPLLALLWVSLGALFVLLWGPLGPLETSWGAKINEKSIQNSIKISIGFLSVSWSVFGQFWERFGEPEPSKMVFSCRRGAIFEKIMFFRLDKVLDGYCHDV